MANKGLDFNIHKVWVDQMTNAKFVDYLFEAYLLCKKAEVDTIYIYIENNTLQNPSTKILCIFTDDLREKYGNKNYFAYHS